MRERKTIFTKPKKPVEDEYDLNVSKDLIRSLS